MRYLPMASLVIGSLIMGASCTPIAPAGPASSPQGFAVQAKPGVACQVAGGGFIEYVVTVDPKVTFGFNLTGVGPIPGATGEVEVVDHGTGYNFHGGTIDEVDCLPTGIGGTSVTYIAVGHLSPQSSGYPGTFSMRVIDSGEPGKDVDFFSFSVGSGSLAGYTRSGLLAGGNIQAIVPRARDFN